MKKFVIIPVLAVLIGGCASKPEKKIMIGLVNFVAGKVLIISESGKETPARAGLPIDMGMKIQTIGKNSICEIYIKDNAIKIFGDSLVSVDTLMFDKKEKIEKTALVMESGRIFLRIKNKMLKDQQIEVKTSTCTAAVRGTEFFVAENGKTSSVACLDGKVEVSKRKNGETVTIEKKERAVAEQKKLTKAKINTTDSDRLKKDSSVKEITAENKKVFEKVEDGDADALRKIREKKKDMASTSINGEKVDEKKKSKVDLIFFKSKD